MTNQALRELAGRLAAELEDLVLLAEGAMRQANRDGAEYEVNDALEPANQALADYLALVQGYKGD